MSAFSTQTKSNNHGHFFKKKRSDVMSKIRGIDTKPEILVRKFLFSEGFRYRKNSQNLPGSPDIVLPKYKTVIFINGCFWHGHDKCKTWRMPLTRKEYWQTKIGKNQARDKRVVSALKMLGWKVIIVWECQIKNKILTSKLLARLPAKIKRT